MRRTFPQKVKPAPSRIGEHEEMTAQAKQALPETNRRTRTSVAMVGLAISMGAYSLPLPNQSDAVAAEPTASEPVTASAIPSPFEAEAPSQSADSLQSFVPNEVQARGVKHTVQEGQTLWDVARFYGVDATTIAAVNSLPPNSVLRVGQVLVIPTDTRIARAVNPVDSMGGMPGYYGAVKGSASATGAIAALPKSPLVASADSESKTKQDKASENLKQRRESLRSGLSTLSANQPDVFIGGVVSVPTGKVKSPAVEPSRLSEVQRQSDRPTVPSVIASREPQVAYNPIDHSPSSSSSPTSGLISHRVSRGDTLGTIARNYGVSLSQLLQANRISNPNYIFVDQVLVIPQRQEGLVSQSQYTGAIATIPPSESAPVLNSSPLPNSVTVPTTTGTRVAASSLMGVNQPLVSSSSSRLLQYNHVETLKSEIEQMRSKYRTQADNSKFEMAAPGRVATAIPAQSAPVQTISGISGDRVNPEFSSDRYSVLRSQLREKLNRVRSGQGGQGGQAETVTGLAPVPSSPKSQVIAAAPIGSEGYDPLLQSKIGQAVSPELPSLGSGNEYLPGSPSKAAAGYIWPTKGVLTSGFGWRWGRMHKGIDIAGPIGTPVAAAADGVVTYAGWNSGGYGYLVEIQHPDGSVTLYGHNNRILVQVGQQVAQGQQVSEMGSTGYSTGPHLHFEVHPTGTGAVNPMAYLPRA